MLPQDTTPSSTPKPKRKTSRRARGTGSVFHDKRTGKWIARFPPGKDVEQREVTARTKADAQRILDRVEAAPRCNMCTRMYGPGDEDFDKQIDLAIRRELFIQRRAYQLWEKEVAEFEAMMAAKRAAWAEEDEARNRRGDERRANQKNRPPLQVRTRFNVLRRDGFQCQLCGRGAEHGVTLHVDHRYPHSKGGATTAENLWTLCRDCNLGKSNRWWPDGVKVELKVEGSEGETEIESSA